MDAISDGGGNKTKTFGLPKLMQIINGQLNNFNSFQKMALTVVLSQRTVKCQPPLTFDRNINRACINSNYACV